MFYLSRANDSENTKALNKGPLEDCLIDDVSALGEAVRKSVLQLYNNYLSPTGKVCNEIILNFCFNIYYK